PWATGPGSPAGDVRLASMRLCSHSSAGLANSCALVTFQSSALLPQSRNSERMHRKVLRSAFPATCLMRWNPDGAGGGAATSSCVGVVTLGAFAYSLSILLMKRFTREFSVSPEGSAGPLYL